ncbi:hypothetical protein FRC08_006986 [Ceratobasidium sp. 394]|nr:hypothetical protein FRC08_006986 [Ceratobasidium sp. 394]
MRGVGYAGSCEWWKAYNLVGSVLSSFPAQSYLSSRVLVPSEDPGSLNILSACATYRRDILVLPPNEVESTTSIGYAIAAVFTPPEFRGKGYATRMMGLLHFAIAQSGGVPAFPPSWGQPPKQIELPGTVSVLYSGVGTFYAGCPPGEGTGWTIVGTKTAHWILAEINISAVDSKVEMLSQEAAVSTVVADIPLFKRDFESKGPSSRTHFAFQPTAAWCLFQMRSQLDHPDYVASPPTIWGARIQAEDGETHFIVWTYKPYPESQRKLIVVNLRASPVTFPLLFAAVASVARDERHHVIEAWNLDEEFDSAVQSTGGRTFERESQLPALKWYGPGEQVVWTGNNKRAFLYSCHLVC